MNREIKFRGQRVDTKEWVCGNYVDDRDRHYISKSIFIMEREIENEEEVKENNEMPVFMEGLKLGMFHPVISETVGQFTGLKDKNDVDIYEGDLVSFGDVHWEDDGMPDIKEIVFDEDSASFRIYDYLELQGSSLAEKWFIDDMIDCLEVIGNIHSNPELLEYLK